MKDKIPGIEFNGESDNLEKSLYTVLNVLFPQTEIGEMLFYNLDILGIASSGGSACSSGAAKDSHVLQAIGHNNARKAIRFSIAYSNTLDDIHYLVGALRSLKARYQKNSLSA